MSRCSDARDRTRNPSEWSSETTTDVTSRAYRRMPKTQSTQRLRVSDRHRLIPMRLDLDPAYLARVRSVFAPSGRSEPTLRRGPVVPSLRLIRKRSRAIRRNDPTRFQRTQVRRLAGEAIGDTRQNSAGIDCR